MARIRITTDDGELMATIDIDAERLRILKSLSPGAGLMWVDVKADIMDGLRLAALHENKEGGQS